MERDGAPRTAANEAVQNTHCEQGGTRMDRSKLGWQGQQRDQWQH